MEYKNSIKPLSRCSAVHAGEPSSQRRKSKGIVRKLRKPSDPERSSLALTDLALLDAHAVADIRIEKRSRRDSSNAPSPTIFRPTKKQVALDKRIWQASTLDDLLSLALEHTSKFSASSLCNILARSSQLLRTGSAEQRARFRKHEAVKVVFTELANTPSSHFNATDIPAALQACAWLRLAPPGGLLLKFDRRMQAMMAPMMLAGGGENMALPFINALWAFAKLGYRCEHVLTGLESHILQGSHLAFNQCSCTDIAALLWSCAKLQYRSPAMLTVISQEFLGRSVSSLSPANVSQICWAYANLNWSPRYLLLEPLALRAVDCKDAFTVQGLSCTAWALGKLLPQMSPQSSKVLKDCICHLLNQASVTMDSFPIEGVSMVLIAAADANIRHDQLLEATQKRVEESLLSNCGPKDLADIVTAYATLDHPLKQSVADALAVRAQQLLPSFSAVWLSWLFWGFARLGQTPTGLLHAADSMWEQNSDRLRELQPVQQCRLAWAIAQMDHPSGAFWENVASCATNSLVDMKPTELSGLLASFATIGHTPTELLEPAAEHVARHMSSYPPRYLATALWAFGKLGIHPGRGVPDGGPAALNGEPLLSGVAAHVARRVHEFQPRELSMLSWSFATLEHHPGDEYLCATARRLAELIKRGQPVGLQAISTVAWACAKFKFSPIELFQIVAGSAAELLVLSIDQEGGVDDDVVPKQAIKRSTSIANLAFAAAKVGFYDAELFRSISQAALLEMDSISCGEACMLLWSFATLHATPAPELLSACMLRMRESLLSCDPSLVALGVYALGSLLKTHEGHTDLLSKCVTRIAIDRDMNSNLLAKVLWACGSLGWVPPEKPLQRILQTLQKDETVLSVSDVALLVWGLVCLNLCSTQLYKDLAMRISELPAGVPRELDKQQLLIQASLLAAAEAPCAPKALPRWLDKVERDAINSENVPAIVEQAVSALKCIGVKSGSGCLTTGDWALVLRNKEGCRVAIVLDSENALFTKRLLTAKGILCIIADCIEEIMEACLTLKCY